jgi:hypothetical protein
MQAVVTQRRMVEMPRTKVKNATGSSLVRSQIIVSHSPPGFRYFMIGTKTIGGIVVLIIVFFPSWPEADPDQSDNKAKRESDGDS